MEIDKEIIEKTTKCNKDFACLNNDKHILCKVKNCVNNKVHFINCSDSYCPYRMTFGYEYVCNCSIRKEIFNKYHI